MFFAYAVVTHDSAVLFVNEKQITPEIRKHLGDHVTIKPYENVFTEIKAVKRSFVANGGDFKVRRDLMAHELGLLSPL